MAQYILFDLDGTLTDSQQGILSCMTLALKQMDIIPTAAQLRACLGPPFQEAAREIFHLEEDAVQQLVFTYRQEYSRTGLFQNKVYPGIPALLQRLRDAGKILLVATSKPLPYAERILEHFDLRRYFSGVGGASMDGARSSKADVIRYALENTADPSALDKAVMVGDRKHDVAGAHTVGFPCVGVLYGYGDRDELTNAGADYIAETLDDLEEILLRENPI